MDDAAALPAPSSADVESALRRCWQPVARVEDLRDGPKKSIVMGVHLAVFLTDQGSPAVIADRCPHRGASLSMGRVCGGALQCPYHGWEWDGDGACHRIPSLADQGQIPPAARIASYPVREQWGLVWATVETPFGEPPHLPWFEAGPWRSMHGAPFETPVGIGVMIENFRDVAHFAFVHQATFGPMPEVVEPLAVEIDGLEVTMQREIGIGSEARELWGDLRTMRYHAIAPNLVSAQFFTDRGERCLLHIARAISASESAHYWILGLGSGYGEEESLKDAVDFEWKVYQEDLPVVSAVKPRELALDPRDEVSTLADRYTLAYRRAFAEYVRRCLRDA